MSKGENPVVQQRRLRTELRRIREEAGMFQKDVAEAMDWGTSKLIRIETGAVGIAKTDLIALLQHYGVTDQKRVDRLVELARDSRKPAWWDVYKDVYSQQFLTFLGFEASVKVLRQFQVQTLPGLLQTREYAAEVIRSYGNPPNIVSRGVDVRLRRQEVLDREDAQFFYILDEAVVRRQVGGRDVWRAQLERLKKENLRPNVHIRIARFDIGSYIGMKGAFTLFEFPYDDADFALSLEYAHRDVLIANDPEQAADFLETFYELESVAAPESDTEKIIDEILAAYPTTGAQKEDEQPATT
jgi:transcriptional regulator with XRE-family HTH domain